MGNPRGTPLSVHNWATSTSFIYVSAGAVLNAQEGAPPLDLRTRKTRGIIAVNHPITRKQSIKAGKALWRRSAHRRR
jgi:hypothetical protein